MPERAINTKSATGCLLILLPAAMAMSALFVAWPLILGVTVAIAAGNWWQSYEWLKTTRAIDPVFQQLIVQTRGEISPIDLSLKANVSGAVANKYLASRANEFGTGSRQHPERGQIYYFVSFNTLSTIFDDSEGEAPEIIPAVTPAIALPTAPTPPITTEVAPEPPVATAPVTQPESPVVEAPPADLSNLRQLFDPEPQPTVAETTVESAPVVASAPIQPPGDQPLVTIIQSELAKRLDVHSSTIYKRRSEPNFTDWTRNRDPEGLAWGYAEATKEYYRIDV